MTTQTEEWEKELKGYDSSLVTNDDGSTYKLFHIPERDLHTLLTQERTRLKEEIDGLRTVLVKADSTLSLLRYRGDIRNWGTLGMCTAYEVDTLIGELRNATDKKDALSKINK